MGNDRILESEQNLRTGMTSEKKRMKPEAAQRMEPVWKWMMGFVGRNGWIYSQCDNSNALLHHDWVSDWNSMSWKYRFSCKFVHRHDGGEG